MDELNSSKKCCQHPDRSVCRLVVHGIFGELMHEAVDKLDNRVVDIANQTAIDALETF